MKMMDVSELDRGGCPSAAAARIRSRSLRPSIPRPSEPASRKLRRETGPGHSEAVVRNFDCMAGTPSGSERSPQGIARELPLVRGGCASCEDFVSPLAGLFKLSHYGLRLHLTTFSGRLSMVMHPPVIDIQKTGGFAGVVKYLPRMFSARGRPWSPRQSVNADFTEASRCQNRTFASTRNDLSGPDGRFRQVARPRRFPGLLSATPVES